MKGSEKSTAEVPEPPRRRGFFSYIQSFLGFKQSFNAKLFLVLGGALVTFCSIRLKYLTPAGLQAGLPVQEWYWFREGIPKLGMVLHLACVLPSGMLAVLQFIPKIRSKAMPFHRWNGYLTVVLMFLALIGGVIITPVSYGGQPVLQAAIYSLTVLVSGSLALAIINVRALQLDEHRKWMLRAWSFTSIIVTLRVILITALIIVGLLENHVTFLTCDQARFILSNSTRFAAEFPSCQSDGIDLKDTYVTSRATLKTDIGIESALRATFGLATWMAMLVHGVCVEAYIHLTPGESARLRQISYHKQLAKGYANPGSAGITADRWGDGPAYRPGTSDT